MADRKRGKFNFGDVSIEIRDHSAEVFSTAEEYVFNGEDEVSVAQPATIDREEAREIAELLLAWANEETNDEP